MNKIIVLLFFLALIYVTIFLKENVELVNLVPSLDKYLELSTDYETMNQNIIMKNSIEKTKIILTDEINKLNIRNNLLQEDIIIFINEYGSRNNLKISKINFSEASSVGLEENNEEEAKLHGVVMSASVEFKCSYEDMIKFIDEIKSNEVSVSITNFSTMEFENDIFHCSVSLNFYSIKKSG